MTGFGVRSCVGKALADLELALITTTLVRNFQIHLHETVTPDSMRFTRQISVAGPGLLTYAAAPSSLSLFVRGLTSV